MMFKNNKYTKWYYQIIKNSTDRVIDEFTYTEKHHIIPRSLGGDDSPENLVVLTGREHFICHLLLTKMCTGKHREQMAYAAWQQARPTKSKGVKVTSHIYELLRKELSEAYTGRKREPFSEKWLTNMRLGAVDRPKRPQTEITKTKISQSKSGKTVGEDNHFYGKTHSEDTKQKIRTANTGRFLGKPKIKKPCKFCGVPFAPNILARFHDEKCKQKSQSDKGAIPTTNADTDIPPTDYITV